LLLLLLFNEGYVLVLLLNSVILNLFFYILLDFIKFLF